MKTSAFFTTAPLSTSHGGGNVSVHELSALGRVTEVKLALDVSAILPEPFHNINTLGYGPFMIDYFAMLRLTEPVDLIMFNGACFAVTRHKFPTAKFISDVPAHDLEESIKEHITCTGGYPYPEQVDPLLKEIMRHHIKTSDVILTPSKYSADYIIRAEGIPSERVEIIPHGCNPTGEENVSKFPDKFAIGTLGANSPDKGHVYLYRSLIMPSDIALKVRAYLVGRGTDLMKTTVDEFYRGCRGHSDVVAEEHVENVGDFFNALTVYVQPSVTEGFGIPVLEAMSYGRPVIVTEGVGAKDLVENGKNGFVVPIRDHIAIAESIQYFLDNPYETKRMGQEARATAMDYTWDRIEREYEKLYKRVLE